MHFEMPSLCSKPWESFVFTERTPLWKCCGHNTHKQHSDSAQTVLILLRPVRSWNPDECLNGNLLNERICVKKVQVKCRDESFSTMKALSFHWTLPLLCLHECVSAFACLTVLHVLCDDINGLLCNHSEKSHESRVLQGLHQVCFSQESTDGHGTWLETLDSHSTVVVIQPYKWREWKIIY